MVRAKGTGSRVRNRSECTSSAKGRRREDGSGLGGSVSVTGVGGAMKGDVLSVDACTIHAAKATAMSRIFGIQQGISKT
jgi:hypothetical protein